MSEGVLKGGFLSLPRTQEGAAWSHKTGQAAAAFAGYRSGDGSQTESG